jgi:hypothetical protein
VIPAGTSPANIAIDANTVAVCFSFPNGQTAPPEKIPPF